MNALPFVKNLMLGSMLGILTLGSCTERCDNDDPRARIVNNGTAKASVQIQTSGGNTENINNVEAGQMSDWRSFAAGSTEFTVAIQGENDTVVAVNMLNCYEYSIVIDGQNNVSSTATERE